MHRIALLFLLTSLCYLPASISAAELFVGASLFRANLDGGLFNPQVSDNELFPSIYIKSLDRYWGESALGYYIEIDLDSYETSRADEIGLVTKQSIVTSTSGNYLYATPTIFYNLTRSITPNWSVKVGLGLGVGYLFVDGTMMVNTPPGPRVEQINGSDISYSTGMIVRYEYKNLVIQAKEYTPYATIDGLEMELQLAALTVGYRFSF